MKLTRTIFTLCLISLYVNPVSANIDVYEFSSEDKRVEYISLTKELRCPKCQNQDIADSNAPIASDMRREVHRLLEEGQSHDEIVQFMVDRFGDFVTYKPKVSAETFLLWYGPWIFIAIGALIIVVAVRRRSISKQSDNGSNAVRTPDNHSKDNSDDKVKALLKEFDTSNEQDK
jgi:cytochrome c-type biogenesis protein CcmH